MYKRILFAVGFTLLTMPAAFAGGPLPISADVPMVEDQVIMVEEAEAVKEDMYIDPYYYNQGVSISVSLWTEAKASDVYLTANYSAYDFSSASKAEEALNEKFASVKNLLAPYGEVKENYRNVYSNGNYDGKSSFSGSIDIEIRPTNLLDLKFIQGTARQAGFNPWLTAVVNPGDKIDAEAKVAKELKELIAKKKKVYEDILEYTLGKPTSFYLDSWEDTTKYDEKTGMVRLSINANVSYRLQQ